MIVAIVEEEDDKEEGDADGFAILYLISPFVVRIPILSLRSLRRSLTIKWGFACIFIRHIDTSIGIYW